MSALVVDASVAVKWLLDEPGTDAAIALLETDRELCAPALLRIEVAAAIVRRLRLGEIAEEDAQLRLSHAEKILSERRVKYAADLDLLDRASTIALAIKHSLQDCLYVACAERFDAELVTADQLLHKRASASFDFVKLL